MSDSRLEKFIYAICSMDVSDLPVPLSRIEKLWNCLITGETPDFEPLSRNEKYLMAMLDRYDISNLPAPISRGEKLLYKIAVGETDLSDVPGYLSRYEELLKYLIENSGISGGDFEYVLYTLNQSLYTLYATAEKPVKSAILKGNTLMNLMTNCKDEYVVRYNDINNPNNNVANISMMKPNTEYTLFYKAKYRTEGEGAGTLGSLKIGTSIEKGFIGTAQELTTEYEQYVYRFTTSSVVDCFVFATNVSYFAIKECVLLEGDHTNVDIPFFEGMKSIQMPVVKTTGKNLFDKTKTIFDKVIDLDTGIIRDDSLTNITDFIKVIPNTQYTMSFNFTTNMWTRCFGLTESKHGKYITDANGVRDKCYFDSDSKTITFTTSPTTNYLMFLFGKGVEEAFQLEEGSTATSYEPYKSNILTVNEDVTLRGIGEVQDMLDCLTGEKIEYVGEFILDGNSDIEYEPNDGDFYTQLNTLAKISGDYSYHIISDKGKVLYYHADVRDYEGTDLVISGYHDWGVESWEYPGENWLYFAKKDITSKSDMKAWLAQNPVTVCYKLAKPTTKSIDISTVDQDNQPTQLGTFENVTHVSLEAENLIPEVEMEVATHISEELASASPLMDDISTEQQQLEATIDKQSNNIDATMIATTEIYEEIL